MGGQHLGGRGDPRHKEQAARLPGAQQPAAVAVELEGLPSFSHFIQVPLILREPRVDLQRQETVRGDQ